VLEKRKGKSGFGNKLNWFNRSGGRKIFLTFNANRSCRASRIAYEILKSPSFYLRIKKQYFELFLVENKGCWDMTHEPGGSAGADRFY
jgi:hypothetical protein